MVTIARPSFRKFHIRDRIYKPDAPFRSAGDGARRLAALRAGSDEVPFRGTTTTGDVQPGLFALKPTGVSTRPIRESAEELLRVLSEVQRAEVQQPIDGIEWSLWHNAFEMGCGTSLTLMTSEQREAVLTLVRASLSATGFDSARGAMRLNAALGELVGLDDLKQHWLGEWNYGVKLFGSPSVEAPWGWQIHGHHLLITCFVIGDQIVMTPQFIGAEPAMADEGKYAGLTILQDEQRNGLALMQSLSVGQKGQATLYESMLTKDLPTALSSTGDGRHQAGAFKDNLVLPYQGVRADAFTPGQTELLLGLIDTYTSRMRAGHADVWLEEVKAHLSNTHFAWIGASDDSAVFYYRVHSPVILIEFDHHTGVFLDNDEPERFHVHTIVRTPNGNDYGRDLLRLHYEREHKVQPDFLTLRPRPATEPT